MGLQLVISFGLLAFGINLIRGPDSSQPPRSHLRELLDTLVVDAAWQIPTWPCKSHRGSHQGQVPCHLPFQGGFPLAHPRKDLGHMLDVVL